MKAKITLLFLLIFSASNFLKSQVIATTDHYAINANATLTGQNVLSNDTTTLGGTLTASLLLAPANGSFFLNTDGSFYYTPNIGYSGMDTIGYTACDNVICDTALIIILINPCMVPIADAGPDQMICGTTASLVANTPIGGTGTWTFVSGPSATISDPHNPILLFTGLPGNYTLRWTIDNPPCGSSSDDVNINLDMLQVQASSTNTNCGQCDGTAIGTVNGGNPPYTYFWNTNPPSNTPNASNLCWGVYTLQVQDINGCIGSSLVLVNPSGNGPTLVLDSVRHAGCGASSSGTIYMQALGGAAPLVYNLNGIILSPPFTGIPPGIYIISVTDANGCVSWLSVAVNQNGGGPTIVLDSLVNINCSGTSSGSIAVHATGGTGPYTYLWTPGNSTSPGISNLAAGNYTVTVNDSGSCASTHTYTISHVNNLYVQVVSTPANCNHSGTAVATALGAHPPYSYLWSDSAHQTSAVATNLVGGFYTVQVSDSNGCQSSGSVYISSSCQNVIKGRVYMDVNGNCVQDSGEPGIAGKAIAVSSGYGYAYSDANGDYTLYTSTMNLTLTAYDYYHSCSSPFPSCPSTGGLAINFSQLGDTILHADFAYAPPAGNFDLTIHPGWNSASPGFSKHYWVCYYNHGPNVQNAVITFVYDSALIYNSCTQGGVHYPAQHKIEWTFNNVPPASIWNWTTKPEAFFTIPATFGIHDSLCSYFEISPSAGDCYPGDNVLSRCEPVTGSLDPNDKAVYPTGLGANGNILASDSLLTYTIRFQNTGNDTAFTVVVTDTLSQFLNPATIVPGAASHPYTFDLSGQGVLTFRFDNILLPDSNVNLEGSNGYFTYSVRQKPNNPIGSVIANTAYIYFDFNAAVVTNTVINSIYSTVGMREQLSNSAVSVFPNPFKDETNFYINSANSNEIYSFELQDVMGKKLRNIDKLTEKQFSVSRAGLSNGVYFYKIYSKNGIIAIGKLVVE